MQLRRAADDSTFAPRKVRNPAADFCCYLVELTRYVVPPSADSTLRDLFDREASALDSSIVPGRHYAMQNVALFRDLDRRDTYVWARGFEGPIEDRGGTLDRFYGGTMWRAHRTVLASAGIRIDALHAVRYSLLTAGFALGERPPRAVAEDSAGSSWRRCIHGTGTGSTSSMRTSRSRWRHVSPPRAGDRSRSSSTVRPPSGAWGNMECPE